MRTVICYRSYFGATRQYARWLGDALECRVVTFADVTDGLLDDADRVVVLSGSYGGFVPIERFIAVRWGILQHKPLLSYRSADRLTRHVWRCRPGTAGSNIFIYRERFSVSNQ